MRPCSSGVGPELEWLVGYGAVGHERLNLLVVGPQGEPVFLGPRLERGAAEQAPGLGAGTVRLETWEETRRPLRAWPRRSLARVAPTGSRARGRFLVSDGLRAAFVLGLQGALPAASLRARLERAGAAAPRQGRRGGGPPAGRRRGGRPGHRGHRPTAPRGSSRGRGRGRGAPAPRGRGPRHGRVRHRRLRAEQRLAAPRARRARHRGRRAAAARHRWSPPRLLLGHDAHVLGRRPGRRCARPRRSRPSTSSRCAPSRPRAMRRVPASRSPPSMPRPATSSRAGGHGPPFFHRLGHGIGLEVHEEPYVIARQRRAPRRGSHLQHRAGHLPRGSLRGAHRGRRGRAPDEGSESLNERATPARHRGLLAPSPGSADGRRVYHPPTGPPRPGGGPG